MIVLVFYVNMSTNVNFYVNEFQFCLLTSSLWSLLQADPALPFDILLTTYELAVLDAKFLSRLCWRYCIIDEAQRLKNSATVSLAYRHLLIHCTNIFK